MEFNPYKVLAVDPSADIEVISAAYRTLSKKYHPDVNPSPVAEAMMRDLNRAYDILKDPGRRRQIDEQLARQQSYTPPYARGNTGPFGQPNPQTGKPGGPDWAGMGDQVRRVGEQVGKSVSDFVGNFNRPQPPANPPRYSPSPTAADRAMHFYKKELSDETERKSIKLTVFHDSATNRKYLEMRLSAPNERNIVTAGDILLDAQNVFDLTLAFSETRKWLKEPGSPIEMTADYDVYFRQAIVGLNQKTLWLEVIKRTRGGGVTREAILALGERNPRAEANGVLMEQSAGRLQQIETHIQSALQAMR